MNAIDPKILQFVILQMLLLTQKIHDAFVAVHGRPPTLEEWQTLQSSWKSPDEIEADVKAQLASGVIPLTANT